MVERAIVALLTAAATTAADRIDPLQLPRDPTLPAITYQRISTPRPLQHDGDQGYASFRTQINCWANRIEGSTDGYKQVKALADEVRQALNGFRGSAGGVTVGMMQISGDRDEWDPQREFERIIVEASGSYRETKP